MAKVKKEVEELKAPVEATEVVDVIETEGTIITDEVVNAEPEDTDVASGESIITNEPDEELATPNKCECDGLPFVVKNRKGSIKLCIKCNKPK